MLAIIIQICQHSALRFNHPISPVDYSVAGIDDATVSKNEVAQNGGV